MNARYRVYADENGYCRIDDMGGSWSASLTGEEFINGDVPLSQGEIVRYGRNWTPPQSPIWDGVEVREMTEEEIAEYHAFAQAQGQAAFGAQVQAFLAGNEGKNLTETVQFFTLIQTYFPQIVLPTTYYDARAAMNDAIEAALDIGDMLHANRLQNQSRIIQDIYARLLEPNGWTGIKLAQLAQALQGGQ